MAGTVVAVARDAVHRFSKTVCETIVLVEGEGVMGDAHRGATVQHLSRIAVDPTQPNLRQLHLLQSELHHELARQGFTVNAGDMGENVLTQGIDLLGLPRGTRLAIGNTAVVKVTGLRNPCHQLDKFQKGLLAAVFEKMADGSLNRKAGIMAIVLSGGCISPGDAIMVQLPPQPWTKLDRV